jgi:hypothetical protein
VFLLRKSKINVLLAFMKSLANCENPSSNRLQGACSGFLIAACGSQTVVVPKAACDHNNCFKKPAMNVRWRK